MAARSRFSHSPCRFFNVEIETPTNPDCIDLEFDESDLWNCHSQTSQTRPESKKSKPGHRFSSKPVRRPDNTDRTAAIASSLPVRIPSWGKIHGDDCQEESRRDEIDGDSDGEDVRIPPHEFLAKQFERTQIASFSVYEGIGRTLKGRDLSRVRNAIWEKTGFED